MIDKTARNFESFDRCLGGIFLSVRDARVICPFISCGWNRKVSEFRPSHVVSQLTVWTSFSDPEGLRATEFLFTCGGSAIK
jgi:hypothetical protein